jgi:HSP20 family protein
MSTGAKKEKTLEPKSLALRRPSDVVLRLEQDTEQMFQEFFRHPFFRFWGPERWWPGRSLSPQIPAVDVYEEKDDLIVKAEVPGLTKEDLEVSLSESVLTIKGERKKEEEVQRDSYYQNELSYGSFVRTVELPVEVKTDQVKAFFKDGILEIRLPKTEDAKSKTIKLKID